MRRYFEVASRTPVLGATLISTVVLVFAVFPAVPIGDETLDSRVGYTFAEVVSLMESYGEERRRVYAWASGTLDTVLPLVYVSFLGGLVFRLRPSEPFWRLAYLPPVAGMLDLGENVQIIIMLTRYPDISAAQVAGASWFTQSKMYAMSVCLALVVALALVAAVRRLRAGRAASWTS